ncbi:MAG: Mini-ribonuclease 3 [Aminipila sp.]
MEANKLNTTALAYMGDAVYEVYVRKYVLEENPIDINKQNKLAIKFVRAEGQALAIKKMLETLTDMEVSLVKRARNRKITSKPNNADPVTYKLATAFEALIGYLYLSNDIKRMEEVIEQAMVIIDNAEICDVRKKGKK